MSSKNLINKILEAPVGHVISVLNEILEGKIELEIIEQNSVSQNHFVRKIAINVNGFPVIRGYVKFDSSVFPKSIMEDLLRKKLGIGEILIKHNIKSVRNIINLNINPQKTKADREYEIITNGVIWFTIKEEIRLTNINSN
jgi:chorismate-pyruvate lyase